MLARLLSLSIVLFSRVIFPFYNNALLSNKLAEVVIQDKRLGFMKYTLMIGIAIFILLYQILYGYQHILLF